MCLAYHLLGNGKHNYRNVTAYQIVYSHKQPLRVYARSAWLDCIFLRILLIRLPYTVLSIPYHRREAKDFVSYSFSLLLRTFPLGMASEEMQERKTAKYHKLTDQHCRQGSKVGCIF